MNKKHIRFISFILAGMTMVVSCIGCAKETYSLKSSKELTKDMERAERNSEGTDYSQYVNYAADFSIDLFRRSIDGNDNCVISPVSVMLSLGMTANGASGDTLSQMIQTIGGEADIEELNAFYSYLIDTVSSDGSASGLSIANSLWIKNTLEDYVQDEFLETVAGDYDAQVFSSLFDDSTIDDVNSWTDYYTDGLIDEIIERIEENHIMYIVSAVAFDAKWETEYGDEDISEGQFTGSDGTKADVKIMNSVENLYISGDDVTGFIKPYDGNYSFAAFLPDENTDINTFIESLDGDSFMELVLGAEEKEVHAGIPEFESSSGVDMAGILKDMGIADAFTTDADFTNMLSADGPAGVEIDSILHKTNISVNAEGTKAASATNTVIDTRGAEVVYLDRPFVYAVIDDTTSLPVFIGVVTEM